MTRTVRSRVDPALFPGRAHARYGGVQVLGDRTGRVGVAGVAARTQVWRLDRTELKDVQMIHARMAYDELREEQKGGSLREYNRFVDGSQFRGESDVKLGGTIQYDAVASLTDLMMYIELQLYEMYAKFEDTGALKRSSRWVHNSADVGDQGVPILDRGDQLVVYGDIRYAKYQESGTIKNKARWVYKKVAARARRRFGKAFIIEHKFIQNASILNMVKIPKRKFTRTRGREVQYSAFTKQYYKDRWAQSFPGIRITQRQGVGFYV